MKMLVRFHVLGVREGVTRSLESAIMAPSLKTARSTISRVGKYLQTCKQVESGAVSRLSQERSANLDPMTLQVRTSTRRPTEEGTEDECQICSRVIHQRSTVLAQAGP